jgi:glycosyltransferase involved in cell wall biosynthesis
MLGWEYPPHIAGGLGTACEGLTSALAAQGVSIHFVVPEVFGGEHVEHMRFSSAATGQTLPKADTSLGSRIAAKQDLNCVERTRVPTFLRPYWSQRSFSEAIAKTTHAIQTERLSVIDDPILQSVIEGEVYGVDPASVIGSMSVKPHASDQGLSTQQRYSASIFAEVERFTADVLSRFMGSDFDIIHAHDWMTFPAGVALAQATRKPLIVHVHSLEHDRSGIFCDESINSIEGFGLRTADKIIAVSHYTKSSIQRHHKIAAQKIAVVHNGTYPKQLINEYRQLKTWPKHVVLFLGRVTFQKGPEYFVDVARKVIPHIDDVLFVLAGDGDLLPAIRERVAQLELKDYFLFPGFVQGEELEELFSVADLYVMPSVSEPFGITALEAISYETPVLLSKQSGVSEVIEHALKVDFWDIDRMADLIINALTHEELRHELIEKAKQEVAALHWGAAASKTMDVYAEVRQGAQQLVSNS